MCKFKIGTSTVISGKSKYLYSSIVIMFTKFDPVTPSDPIELERFWGFYGWNRKMILSVSEGVQQKPYPGKDLAKRKSFVDCCNCSANKIFTSEA